MQAGLAQSPVIITIALLLVASSIDETTTLAKEVKDAKVTNLTVLYGPSGTVRYPDGRVEYSNYEDVSWLIDLQEYGASISVIFMALNLEVCTGCQCDSVRLYDGPNTNASEIANLCGTYGTIGPYTTTGSTAFVRFISDYSGTFYGFTFSYATTNATITTRLPQETTTAIGFVGNQTIYDLNGTIKYPASGYYEHDLNLVWRIEHRGYESYSRIKFAVKSIDIEICGSSNTCSCDALEVWDGLDPDYSNVVLRQCGATLSLYASYTTGPLASVRFKSDHTINGTGFTLKFSTEVVEPLILDDWTGNITHPASGGTYEHNELKLWRIDHRRYGWSSRIRITIQRLGIEECPSAVPNENCGCDVLEIFDGSDPLSSSRLLQTCGRALLPQVLYSSGPVATVKFSSDYSEAQIGFTLLFEGESNATEGSTIKPTTTEEPNKLPWPRADELLGFWPLDNNARLSDITGKTMPCKQCNGILQTSLAGPFGQTGTSYTTIGSAGKDILDVEGVRPVSTNAITISMSVRAPTTYSGTYGLLSFSDSAGVSRLQMDILYSSISSTYRPMLRIRNANSTSVTTFNIFQPNEWTFFAVVIENSKWSPCTVSVYGRHGLVYNPIYRQGLCDDLELNNNINLGSAYSVTQLPSGIAVSCLMLHSTKLTDSEIRHVYHSCRAAQGTPPCGSPMIPYPSIPADDTNTPKYGQFPWIASLRRTSNLNAVICSAGIYNSFYLVTSASCFKSSSRTSDYTVRVGDFDLTYTEPHERTHSIRGITIYPLYDNNTSIGDIALIELSTAIDFTNMYVSPMCFPEFALSQTGDVPSDETLYFYGWGQYGRSSLVSQSSPRYFLGSRTSSNCSEWYLDEYKQPLSTCFQVQTEAARKVPCNGDEGSPLMYASTDMLGNDNLKTIGIFTKHVDCSPTSPALFTLIAPYMQWITQVTACTLPGYFYPTVCPMYAQ